MEKFNKVKILYRKYLDRDITDEEFDLLFDWLKDPRNMKLLKEEMGKDWVRPETVRSPVDWDNIRNEYLKRKNSRSRWSNSQNWGLGVAASVAIIIAVIIVFRSSPSEIEIYETGFAEVLEVTLDDGSLITLNANSRLEWAKDWQKENRREVFLSGEAFFNVESVIEEGEPMKVPFIVNTQDLSVRVVGTSFNVKSRGEQTDVYLDEGKVELGLHERNDTTVVMKPGQVMSYSVNTSRLIQDEGSIDRSASWKEGSLQYSSKRLGDILKSVEDIYGKEFQISDADLLDRKYSAVFPYSDWEVVKKSIELLTGVDLEEKEGIIKIKK